MNNTNKIAIIVGLIVLVGITVAIKNNKSQSQDSVPTRNVWESSTLPRLVDLGAGKCQACKMMEPVLEELRKEYAGRLAVEYYDVWENEGVSEKFGIKLIPTQIFIAPSGKELFRHEGFISKEDILAKWKEHGFDFSVSVIEEFSRLEPLVMDTRPADTVCYMCDGNIEQKTKVTLTTEKGDVNLCGVHCYFITYTSLLEKEGVDERVLIADWNSGQKIAAVEGIYLYGLASDVRPSVKAFGDRQQAEAEQKEHPGIIFDWEMLKSKELSLTCGFCDRALYPEDSAKVIVEGGMQSWGCCPMCAMGIAARTGKDIEVFQKDALTGEVVHVKTTSGSISLLEPETAVAWSGKKKLPDGKLVSAGCFKQAFFVNEENLKNWVDQDPTATGMMISIHDALAAKMKLSPEQIQKACKIGECSPK